MSSPQITVTSENSKERARDVMRVASNPGAEVGRVLRTTPHHIGVIVAHEAIDYGSIITEAHGGHVLHCIKRAIFRATRDAIIQQSGEPPGATAPSADGLCYPEGCGDGGSPDLIGALRP